jgi:hypothetical protein
MKLAVFLGGPFHGVIRWVEHFEELHALDPHTDLPDSPRPPRNEEPDTQLYRFAFGDEHIGIYYWRLNDFQVKAVRQQVVQLRVRHGELNEIME